MERNMQEERYIFFQFIFFVFVAVFFLCLRFFCFLLYLSFLSLSLSFLFCLCFVVALCLFVTVCALSVSVTFIPQLLPHLRRQHPLSSSLPSRQPTPFGSSCIDFGLITGQSMFCLVEKKSNLEECGSMLQFKKVVNLELVFHRRSPVGLLLHPECHHLSFSFYRHLKHRSYFIFGFVGELTRKI